MRVLPHANVAVVGGGIIGLATARELLLRGVKRITLVEAEPTLASHQTARNSGVIHAGIYYAPNSLKARLCLEGMRRTYHYCDHNSIPYRKVGKLIVALDQSELPALEQLYRHGTTNAVPGIRLLRGNHLIREVEPECAGIAAIHSPETGIVDWRVVANHYAADIRERKGTILTSSPVTALEHRSDHVRIHITSPHNRTILPADRVITCAGLQSDRVARMLHGANAPQIIPVKGEYLRITNSKIASNIRGNIYPVPNSGSGNPFLGVHFTPTISGDVIVGPNALPVLSRTAYDNPISLKDIRQMLSYVGFWRLAIRQWRYAAREIHNSLRISAAAAAASRYVPALGVADFTRCNSRAFGIRAQAVSPKGELVDDFVFESAAKGSVLHVRNAPSPGATSSLAIARIIADRSSRS